MMLKHSSLRPLAGRNARSNRVPRPFSSSNVKPSQSIRLIVRAAETEEAPAEPETFAFVEEEDEPEIVELDDEAREAIRVAEQLMQSYTAEAALEVEFVQDESEKQVLQEKAEALLEAAFESTRGNLSEEFETAAELLTSGVEPTEVEIEDFQSGAGFGKYDEEEDYAVSPEIRSAVLPYKLTRQELANLVPEDWATVNVDWFTSKKEDKIPLPEYRLCFLWTDQNLGVAVDQVYSRGQTSPLTEYYFWPRKDAWEELKTAIELRPWVTEREKVILLNRLTEVINFWQTEETKHTVDEARATFPDCAFA